MSEVKDGVRVFRAPYGWTMGACAENYGFKIAFTLFGWAFFAFPTKSGEGE